MGSGASLPKEEMDDLVSSTHYKKRELKRWYAKFITDFPSGRLNHDEFIQVFGKIYQSSEKAEQLAKHIFRSFDADHDGRISFKELMCTMSVTSRGTAREKLEWAFKVYDVNDDGQITIDEIREIVKCTRQVKHTEDDDLQLVHKNSKGKIDTTVDSPKTKPDKKVGTLDHLNEEDLDNAMVELFLRMDTDSDGHLSMEEFCEGVQAYPTFIQILNRSTLK